MSAASRRPAVCSTLPRSLCAPASPASSATARCRRAAASSTASSRKATSAAAFSASPMVGPGGQKRSIQRPCFREPPGPRIERGPPHRLADACRRKPRAPVAARSAIACRHPVTPPCAKRDGGDATMFDAALSRPPSNDTPPDRAGGATRSARAFGSASAAQSPRSATAGTRYRQGLRRHRSRPRPP